MRRPLLLLLLLALAAALALRGRAALPDRWNPWAPLVIAQPPNLLTRFKLMRLGADEALCRQVLAQAPMRYEPVADRVTGEGCGFDNAVRISRTTAEIGAAFTLSCRAAVSLALWEQHVLQPAAQRRFGRRVVRIEHFGSYACRNVDGAAGARRSRHATADALDIAGVVLAGGRRIRVLHHWDGEAEEAAFLRELHAGGCRYFTTVLGPDYNAAHRDHLHLDRGAFGVCR